MTPLRRRLAVGGIVGPAGFIGAWTWAGLATDGYSPVSEFISDLAALGAPHRPEMTAGFVCFGLAVPTYAIALRSALPGPAWMAAAISGASTLAAAAFPLQGTALQDRLHSLSAATGYLTLALTPLLAARPLARLGYRRAAAASVAISAASGLALAASTLGPAHGFFQRAGLTVVDVWVVATAVAILRSRLSADRG
ncbi:MAG: DUF998 domain-containing protein [Acidimicrobiales bacterium]